MLVKLVAFGGHGSWCLQTVTVVNQRSLITDQHNKHPNDGSLKKCENCQNVTQRHEMSKYCRKMAPIDLLGAGSPRTFSGKTTGSLKTHQGRPGWTSSRPRALGDGHLPLFSCECWWEGLSLWLRRGPCSGPAAALATSRETFPSSWAGRA